MWHDLTHSTIGFWTDNGGYYHYATGVEGCKPGNCTSYETVLPKVKAYHDSIGVPFRHWQFGKHTLQLQILDFFEPSPPDSSATQQR